MHQHGFTGAWGRNDEAALAEADGRKNIYGAHRDVFRDIFRFKQDALERVIRREFFEGRDVGNGLGREAHDFIDAHNGGTTIAGLRGLHQNFDLMAALETVAID